MAKAGLLVAPEKEERPWGMWVQQPKPPPRREISPQTDLDDWGEGVLLQNVILGTFLCSPFLIVKNVLQNKQN